MKYVAHHSDVYNGYIGSLTITAAGTWGRPEEDGMWKLLYFLTLIGELMRTAFMQCFVYTLMLCINSPFVVFNLYPSSSVQITLELLVLERKSFMLRKAFNAGIFCVLVSTLVETCKA